MDSILAHPPTIATLAILGVRFHNFILKTPLVCLISSFIPFERTIFIMVVVVVLIIGRALEYRRWLYGGKHTASLRYHNLLFWRRIEKVLIESAV